MKKTFSSLALVAFTAATVSAFWLNMQTSEAQNPTPRAEIPRTPDGRPDLNGIWQTNSEAYWSLEATSAAHGPLVEAGAHLAFRPSIGYVRGGVIPYREGMREIQRENRANWLELDPATKCFKPGVPRATYKPYPFQIFLAPDVSLFAYQFSGTNRIVYMDRPDMEPAVDTWMGHNLGHWDGDTLVIDVYGQMAETWFDRAGNHHSGWDMHVQERYTMIDANTIHYEATITDANVFDEPWTIEMPIYRRQEENFRLLEFKCVEFVEELLYGHLRRPGDPFGDGLPLIPPPPSRD